MPDPRKFLSIIFLNFLLIASIFAEQRNALLIANSNYKNFRNLSTPIQEAHELKKTLEQLDFAVTILEDSSLEEMSVAIDRFGTTLKKQGGIGFFHYGGHAVQVNGKNYLIPADADIPNEKKVEFRAYCVDELMPEMCADTNIIILDSCRNNPLPSSSRSATRGLGLVTNRPKNSIIIYSAEPGNVATDGVFTPVLTKRLTEKKELLAILRDVRREVLKLTDNEQKPGEYSELETEVYLAGYDNKSLQPTVEDYIKLGNEAYDKQNYSEAFSYYQNATNITSPIAQQNLGYMYYYGCGVAQDFKKAFKWFEKSAKQGHFNAQFNLGNMYCRGEGINKSYEKAKYWFEKASEQGYCCAQFNLGCMYYNGDGVEKNYEKAFEFYQKAAEQDYAPAQCELGTLYYYGEGINQNFTKAKYWFEKAAEQGYCAAQYNLGTMYEYGHGVKQDIEKAKEFYEKAAKQDFDLAIKKLNELKIEKSEPNTPYILIY